MVSEPFPFDAVLFDLDGTLVATDRYWIDAARAGTRRALEELGIAHPVPSAEEWTGIIGFPSEEGIARLFPDLEEGERELLLRRCREEEARLLRAGRAAALPGAQDALSELRRRGVSVGVASNCSAPYLESVLASLGLGASVDRALCLDSPGIADKADMVADLLASFGTRSAVLVGDRATDAEAARANAVPHVHVTRGYARSGEIVEAEGRIEDLHGLLPLLEQRTARVLEALGALGALGKSGVRTIGITGPPASGKTLFARDAARLLAARGREVEVLAEDGEPELADVLEARRADRGPGLLLVEGGELLEPRLRPYLDRVLYLSLDERSIGLRVAGRAGRGRAAALETVRRDLLPGHRRTLGGRDPRALADLVLDAVNPLEPAPLPSGA